MRTFHIIMPMAGEASRFRKEGINTPKPLIKLHDIMLVQRALSSVKDIEAPRKYSFIVRQEHIDNFNIDQVLLNEYPDSKIISVAKTTRGAVETCLLAKEYIDKDDAILILDCDLEFYSNSFNELILRHLLTPFEHAGGGGLVSFTSSNNRYSYAECDENNLVIRTAEKEPISNNALVGAYFFSTGKGFLDAALHMMSQENSSLKEFYVSLLFNFLIAKGDPVSLAFVDKYYSYGTPAEYNTHL